MRNSLLIGACLAAALCACNKQEDVAPAPGATQAPASSAARTKDAPQKLPAQRRSQAVTAEELARIKATGRSGLWSEPDAFCAKATRQQATLFWNVEAKGVKRTTIALIDKAGHERRLGQGGPIGRKATGPWLRSGATFILRDRANKSEIGKLTIPAKQC